MMNNIYIYIYIPKIIIIIYKNSVIIPFISLSTDKNYLHQNVKVIEF